MQDRPTGNRGVRAFGRSSLSNYLAANHLLDPPARATAAIPESLSGRPEHGAEIWACASTEHDGVPTGDALPLGDFSLARGRGPFPASTALALPGAGRASALSILFEVDSANIFWANPFVKKRSCIKFENSTCFDDLLNELVKTPVATINELNRHRPQLERSACASPCARFSKQRSVASCSFLETNVYPTLQKFVVCGLHSGR